MRISNKTVNKLSSTEKGERNTDQISQQYCQSFNLIFVQSVLKYKTS